MASHLRLHLAAPPPLHQHPHSLRLLRPPKLPLLNLPSQAALSLRPHTLSSAPARTRVGGIETEADSNGEGEGDAGGAGGLVGEDADVFRLADQRVASWAYFTGILSVVLYALNVLWIDPATGVGTRFLAAVTAVSDSPEVKTSRSCAPSTCPLRRSTCSPTTSSARASRTTPAGPPSRSSTSTVSSSAAATSLSAISVCTTMLGSSNIAAEDQLQPLSLSLSLPPSLLPSLSLPPSLLPSLSLPSSLSLCNS